MANGNILIVDDNEEILVALMLFLREHFTKVHARKNPQEALDCLHSEDIDVFILDMNLSPEASKGRDGIELMNTIRRINPTQLLYSSSNGGMQSLLMLRLRQVQIILYKNPGMI